MEDNKIAGTETFNTALGSSLQGQNYNKCHKVFLRNCQQIESCLQNLHLHLPPAMENLSLKDDVCKVLSVGSSDGWTDLQVVQILKDVSKKKVYNKVIEPNEYSLNEYKKSVLNQRFSELSEDQVIFDITKPQTFQDYMTETKTDPVKFDVVHFIHSIYYMDFEETLIHCYFNELGDKGLIICIIAGDDVIYKMKKKLFNVDQTTERIIEIIKKRGWKYQHHTSQYYVDVTEVFDEQSETGNLLLDFLTQTLDCRATMDSQTFQELIETIMRSSDTIRDKKMCKKVDDYIFILK